MENVEREAKQHFARKRGELAKSYAGVALSLEMF